jgi:hypothetical protein
MPALGPEFKHIVQKPWGADMKTIKQVFGLWLLLVFTIGFIGGCDGGGSSDSDTAPPISGSNTAPTISDFSLSPKSAYLNSGGGQIDVSGTFTYTGANGGVASVTYVSVDSSGNTTSSQTIPVDDDSGATSGAIAGVVTVGTTTVGTYIVRVSLTDKTGLSSNVLSENFTISLFPWVSKAPMPHPRTQFAVAASKGLAYVVGGELMGTGTIPGPDSALVDIYNPASNTWNAGVPLPTARKGPAAASVDSIIYVIGGNNLAAPGGLSVVEAYDPATGQWTTKAPMPTPRSGAAATVIEGRICVMGGTSVGLDLTTTECFDPISNAWSAGSPMPTFRRELGAASIGNYGYAVGGYSGGNFSGGGPGYVATVERYDISANSWASMPPMPTERDSMAVVAVSGILYVVGGDNALNRSLATVEAFDPSLMAWTTKTAMPVALTSVGGVLIDGKLYVFEQGTTLEYTPENDIL